MNSATYINRRSFINRSTTGIGAVALASLLSGAGSGASSVHCPISSAPITMAVCSADMRTSSSRNSARCAIADATTSSADAWPIEMNQKALVRMASEAVKCTVLTGFATVPNGESS